MAQGHDVHSALAKNDPLLPDLCHPDAWQPSAPEPKTPQWASDGLQTPWMVEVLGNGHLVLPGSLANLILGVFRFPHLPWCILNDSNYEYASVGDLVQNCKNLLLSVSGLSSPNPRETNLVPRGLQCLAPDALSTWTWSTSPWQGLSTHPCSWMLLSGRAGAFPCCEAQALTVTNKLLENVFPPWGVAPAVSSDAGTHFTGTPCEP